MAHHENRMTIGDKINFNCFPGIPCFTQCCKNVNIVLSPYDVLRLKNALGMRSEEFLDKYTIIVYKEKKLLPIVILKMNKEDKKCPFVSDKGCKVYADRPWACRMFPLDINDDGTFKFMVGPDRCLGLNEKKEWTISDWLFEQGIPDYEYMNSKFSEITRPLKSLESQIDNPQIQDMLFMALYNLDKFREFILTSSFLDKFDLNKLRIERILVNDVELLKLGFDWIKFGLFGEKTLRVKEKALSKSRNAKAR